MEQTNETLKDKNSVDLTEGNLVKKIILYTLPIIATGILSLLFNAADIIVVGRYASDTALAAVSATSALINLIVNLILGLAVGAGVGVAKCFGSKDDDGMSKMVHTSMLTSVIGGLFFGVFGYIFAKYFLELMATPENVIDQSSLYVKIYFIGIPFAIVYNFGAAILRSVGDTKRPLIFLIIAGVVNVILNLFFVIVLKMDVDGVAWATTISQVLSMILVVVYLIKVKASYRLYIKKLRIHKSSLKEILLIGIPAGVQGSLFSISNVIIQSGINSFGDVAMSGNGAAGNIEGFVYTSMNAFHQTALAFIGQHIGANKCHRIGKITLICVLMVSGVGLVLGIGAFLLARPLLSIYAPGRDDVIEFGITRMSYVCAPYFLCGIMDVLSGASRGMGKSISTMIITLVSVCGLRILWIYTVFRQFHKLSVLYISYPISWAVCVAAQAVAFVLAYSKIKKEHPVDEK